ncbi:MAG: CHAT domain-containing protein [Bacteroidota bacterium]
MHLRNLSKEANSLRSTLRKAKEEKLCEFDILGTADLPSIVDSLNLETVKNRIAIFHFAGHAGGFRLMIEGESGNPEPVYAQGFSSLLGARQNLKLVFLNGCSTELQAELLLSQGIPIVIATSESIRDDVAAYLSERFYQWLSQGVSLREAWETAKDEVLAKVNIKENAYRDLLEANSGHHDRFPWKTYTKHGSESVWNWNLLVAANNPLFGLPSLDLMKLPSQPYRYLQRYEKEHSRIFFGRGIDIRKLYDRSLSEKGANMILFYGQSGVGKSSILEAGLLPRLKQKAEVLYLRRNRGLGLLGTFKEGLVNYLEAGGVEVRNRIQRIEELEHKLSWLEKGKRFEERVDQLISQIKEEIEKEKMDSPLPDEYLVSSDMSNPDSLFELWTTITENLPGMPLVVLLDQVEEVFTQVFQENQSATGLDELDEFCLAVQKLFAHPNDRVRGKLLLSFRKEYVPEIEKKLAMHNLAHEKIFVEHLAKAGVEEVVHGLTTTEELIHTYQLEVEEGLGASIAEELLESPDSPVAPILQIMLTRMWEHEEPKDKRYFSYDLFRDIYRDQKTIKQFLTQKVQEFVPFEEVGLSGEVQKKYEGYASSGLILDILQFHTSSNGTVGITRKQQELTTHYAHIAEDLSLITDRLSQLYLLSYLDKEKRVTRLAHDTLAPEVKDMVRTSDLPGLRAIRILENKVLEFSKNNENLLDDIDLEIVEAGIIGMRNIEMESEEGLLIAKSSDKKRKKLNEIKRRKRRDKWIGRATVAVAILFMILAGFAFYNLRQVNIQKEIADEERQNAEKNAKKAERQERLAEFEKIKAEEAAQRAELEAEKAEEARILAEEEAERAEREARNAMYAQEKEKLAREFANQKRQDAESAAEKARIAKIAADSARLVARQRYFEALSQKIAVKSGQVDDEALQAKLAMVGYSLYQCGFDNPFPTKYSSEIYNGLYHSINALEGEHRNLYTDPKGAVKGAVKNVVFARNNLGVFYTAGNDGLIRSGSISTNIDPRRKNIIKAINSQDKQKGFETWDLTISETGRYLVSCNKKYVFSDNSSFSNLQIYDTYSFAPVEINLSLSAYQGRTSYGKSVAYRSAVFINDEVFYASTDVGTVEVWTLDANSNSWYPIEVLNVKETLLQLAYSKEYEILAAINGSYHLKQWKMGTSRDGLGILRPLEVNNELLGIQFSTVSFYSKKGWLVAGDFNGVIYFGFPGNLTGRYKKQKIHSRRIRSIVFHPDRDLFASSSNDGTIQLWDISLDKGKNEADILRKLPVVLSDLGKNDWSMALDFSPDGQYLMAGYKDNAVKVWDTDQEVLADKLSRSIIDNKVEDLTSLEWLQYVADTTEVPYLKAPRSLILNGRKICEYTSAVQAAKR